MSEARIVELETRIAFQEKALEELNEALIDQQQQIDRLEKTVAGVLNKLNAAGTEQ